MESALIGLVGVLIGVLLTQYFRRGNRIEQYSQKVFEKRLEIHEKLFVLLLAASDVASDVMEDQSLSKDARKEAISSVILPLCKYTDANEFYLNQHLCAHIICTFMGAEDIMDIDDPAKREAEKSLIYKAYKDAKRMLIEESGVREISKHFQTISKSSPDSNFIRYMEDLEKNAV